MPSRAALFAALEFKVGRSCSDPRAERIGHRLRIADRIGICASSDRNWLWTAGHIGIRALSGRGRLGVGEGSVDFLIEQVDQASRRGLRSANAIRLLILARTGYTMTTVAAIAMARIIGAPPHRIGSFYLACGAIGSNIQTRSKEPVNVSNSLHRPARPSSRQAAPAGAAFLSLARCE
jgi:hypothetical protein